MCDFNPAGSFFDRQGWHEPTGASREEMEEISRVIHEAGGVPPHLYVEPELAEGLPTRASTDLLTGTALHDRDQDPCAEEGCFHPRDIHAPGGGPCQHLSEFDEECACRGFVE